MSRGVWEVPAPQLRAARLCGAAGADGAEGGEGGEDVTVVAPLTDAHVHLELADLPAAGSGSLARVLDLGGDPRRLAARARTAEQSGAATEIRWAGAFLTAPGGYPTDRGWAPAGSTREIRTPAEAAAAVAEQLSGGACLIKVALHADARPVLDDLTLRAVVDSARGGGVPVVAHVEGPGQAARAAAAGVQVLAHTPWTERLDDDLLAHTAERMVWISTLDMHRRDGDTQAWETATENLRGFLSRGGRAVYGTDLGNGLSTPELHAPEVEALVSVGRRAGLDDADLLAAFTGAPLLPDHAGIVSVLPAEVRTAGEALAALSQSRPVRRTALKELPR